MGSLAQVLDQMELPLAVSTRTVGSSAMEQWMLQIASNTRLPLAACWRSTVRALVHAAVTLKQSGANTVAAFRLLSLTFNKRLIKIFPLHQEA